MIESVMIAVFMIGYFLIALEHKISINKAAVALLLAVVCWVFNFVRVFPHDQLMIQRLSEHLGDIAQITIFLLGAMTIVELIDSHRGFKIIMDFIRSHNKRMLLWVVSFITFFVSSVLDNLTTSIIMVTLLRRLIEDKKERMIFASMVIIAANAGGAWTPIGDVTTTMLWIGGYVSSGGIIKRVFFPSLISMVIPLVIFSIFSIKGKLHSQDQKEEDTPPIYGAKRVFALGVGALIFVPILKSLTGLPPYMGILLGLGMMWGLTDLIHQERHFLRVPHILTKIDVSSVLFFLGILLAVAALETAGILDSLSLRMDYYFKDKDLIVAIMGIISSIIDNVPLTAAMMGMYDLAHYPMDSRLWEFTAYCVGTGGSLLIIGSAAGVVVMGMENISFAWYLRRITLVALLGYLGGLLVMLI